MTTDRKGGANGAPPAPWLAIAATWLLLGVAANQAAGSPISGYDTEHYTGVEVVLPTGDCLVTDIRNDRLGHPQVAIQPGC